MEEELKNLLQILYKIFPNHETINPFYKVQLDHYPSNYEIYHKLLTHFLTLVYSKHRPMEKARYITSREDVIASLNILEITLLQQHRKEEKNAKDLHQVLKTQTLKDQVLSAKNISDIIGYKKTQTSRFIEELLNKNLLERIDTSKKNKGYLYKLK